MVRIIYNKIKLSIKIMPAEHEKTQHVEGNPQLEVKAKLHLQWLQAMQGLLNDSWRISFVEGILLVTGKQQKVSFILSMLQCPSLLMYSSRQHKIVGLAAGKSRGYAFIEFEHKNDMKTAYKMADGKKIEGKRVVVDVERGRTVPNW